LSVTCQKRLLLPLAAVLAAALSSAFALAFAADLLGGAPVLDARENLAWAERMAEGALAPEPIYRALLYPWLLSFFAGAGEALPQVATGLGVLAHLLNALLAGLLARELWRRREAAWLAGLLYAAYPVAHYFSAQVLDITPGISLFLGATLCLLRGLRANGPGAAGLCLLAGLLGGLAVLMRPNFLSAVLLFPVLAAVLFIPARGQLAPPFRPGLARVVRKALLTGVALVFVLGLQGLVNGRLSGEFRILPWQGAYNLYAANREGANGKFYQQRVAFESIPAGMNSTRMESEYLYRVEAGPDAPASVDAMNAFWKERLREEILADPGRWAALMGRKALYLFNDREQYNNLSYPYQKQRFVLLRYNPLGWGLLLLCAAAGLVIGWRHLDRRAALAIGLLAAAYAAGVLLFFVSARFRLPLAPLLCVCAGGLALGPVAALRAMGGLARTGLLASLAALATLAYGDWANARDDTTFIQDELLLANAAARLGRDADAVRYAEDALARDPERQDALRTSALSRFNLALAGEPCDWTVLADRLDRLKKHDAATLGVSGVVFWRRGEPDAAYELWRAAVERFGDEAGLAKVALELTTGGREPEDEDERALWRMLERAGR
jgi:hypothetical protein